LASASEKEDCVMQLPNMMLLEQEEGNELKVIESKTIFYCANFDLNINEWFNEYENIEIFKMNIQKNLGKLLYY